MSVARISRRLLVLIVLTVFGVCLAYVLGELVIRGYYGDKFSKRPAFYGPSQNLGWAPAANLNHRFHGADFVTHIRTDKNGYRLGALGNVDYDNELIVLCGDSFTFGWGVSTGETFASYLDEAVAEYTDGRMRVVNLAVGGYGTWQHQVRLQQFHEAYPEANVAAVVVFHCMNDATDNFATIGYTHGSWITSPVTDDMSRWHLLNFLSYARERLQPPEPALDPTFKTAQPAKKRAEPIRKPPRGPRSNHPGRRVDPPPGDTLPPAPGPVVAAKPTPKLPDEPAEPEPEPEPGMEDVLWRYTIERTVPLPEKIGLGTDSVDVSVRTSQDTSPNKLMKRKSLSKLQREVYYMANKAIHQTAAAMGCPVFHGYVYTTEDWYIHDVDSLIDAATNTRGSILGRIPVKDSFDGTILNDHSGRHFTPELNRFWAEQLLELLVSGEIVRPETD
jgi:hypothetical protein